MEEKKIRKTLFLPKWVVAKLDREGEICGGPGVIAAAAINHFCSAPPQERAAILEKFHQRDVADAYNLINDIADDLINEASRLKNKKRKRK